MDALAVKNKESLSFQRKIKLEVDPTQWRHHRGGWSHVLQLMNESLVTKEGTLLISAVEEWISDEKIISEPWIGFIHQVPRNNYFYYPDLERLVEDEHFLHSLPYCRGIFVLSCVVKDFLLQHLKGIVPVAEVLYPFTPFPESKMFKWSKFDGKVIFIGEFLRKFQDFYDLVLPEGKGLRKVLVKSEGVRFDRLRDCSMNPLKLITNRSVEVIEERLSDEVYDEWLSSSVVFLSLFDAPANTTVIECLSRNTPLVVNRLPGVEEYLGKEYPLFYDSLQEATDILADDAKLKYATEYLKSLPIKLKLSGDQFIHSFCNTSIYRSLPLPPSEIKDSTQTSFPQYDLTVIICSYKRVYNIQKILEAFKGQEFEGNFEIILWNNNSETQSELSQIVSKFKSKMDIRLIQSSENYYCIVRLAVAHLMRSEFLLICDDDVIPRPNYISTFTSKYQEYGPKAVLCCRGHVFAPHEVNVENPKVFWENYEHLRFYDESKPDRQIHFVHADNCYIPRKLLIEASTYSMPSPDTVLVDDYWLSFVLSHYLDVPLWKIYGKDIFDSTPCSENAEIALYFNKRVENERVNFYVYHTSKGWPISRPLEFD